MDYTSENKLRYAEELSIEVDEITDFISSVNPMGYPDIVRSIIQDNIADVNCYPDKEYYNAKKSLASSLDIEPEKVIFGSGESELIYSFINFLRPKKALVVSPSLYDYINALNSVDCEIDLFDLKEDDYYKITIDQILLMGEIIL